MYLTSSLPGMGASVPPLSLGWGPVYLLSPWDGGQCTSSLPGMGASVLNLLSPWDGGQCTSSLPGMGASVPPLSLGWGASVLNLLSPFSTSSLVTLSWSQSSLVSPGPLWRDFPSCPRIVTATTSNSLNRCDRSTERWRG